MTVPSVPDVLSESGRALRRHGRAALCQIVRTEGSTPGKVGWKMLVEAGVPPVGNLGGGAFEAMVIHDARAKLDEKDAEPEIKRYYLTEEAVRGQPTGMVCGGLVEVFLEVLMAKPLLVICGGGPVGQALAQNGVLCGFEVLVAEDRADFRQPELFPEGTILSEVGRAYDEDFLAPVAGRELYAAVVTRCWETDLAALRAVTRQRPPHLSYLGLMGSRRKVDRVRSDLEALGQRLGDVELHAPIGLPIGGDTPGEIAVSILAEVLQVKNAKRPALAERQQLEAVEG